MSLHPSERWKYIEAVFVGPNIPHPLWKDPIGKQLLAETRSTPRFVHVIEALRLRQWEDQAVNGTYSWAGDHWKLESETDLVDNPLRCPEILPGDVDVLDTASEHVPALQSVFQLTNAGAPRTQYSASISVRQDRIVVVRWSGRMEFGDWELNPEQASALQEALCGRVRFCATMKFINDNTYARCIRQEGHRGRHCDESGMVWL